MIKTSQYLLYWIAYIPIRFVLNVRIDQCEVTADELKSHIHLIIANHPSELDPLFLLALPWELYEQLIPIHFLTGPHIYYKWWLRPWLFLFGAYPLPTSGWTLEQYFKNTRNKINSGKTVMVFPEGQVNRQSEPADISPGLGYLISKTNTQILPIHIKGIVSARYIDFITNKNKVKIDIKKTLTVKNNGSELGIDEYQKNANEVFQQVFT